MSLRTTMLDELVARLAAINGSGGGYNYTNRKATWKEFMLPDETAHYPVTYVLTDATQLVGGQIGTQDQSDEIPVIIWGYVKSVKNPQEVAEKFLFDICKGILTNRTTSNKDASLADTCAAFRITGKDIVGDLLTERRTVEVTLSVRMHTSGDSI